MASMDSTKQQAVKEQNLNLNPNNSYANLFKTPAASPNPTNSIKLKPISFFQGEPSITFDSTEIEAYIKEENLQYALILKFSHGYPDIHEMRKHFPLQFKIKGECNIGLLHPRHFLLRFSLVEDFVNIYSRSVESVLINENGVRQEYEFRVQRWTTTFNPKEETSIALAWISFPGLPCQMFARQAIYSLASAVGRPLHVDKATADKTRPSTARVKVEVNLLSKLPDRVRLCYRDVNSGDMSVEWQTVKYDRLPKFCATCKKQGHGDEDCRLNNQQDHQYDSADMVEKRKLDKFQGDLRNKLNDQRKKPVEGKVDLEVGGRNLQRNSLTVTTATIQEHTTNDAQIIDVPNGNVINPRSSPKGKETEHENSEEWEIVQRKKHGRRRSPIAQSTVANKAFTTGDHEGNCERHVSGSTSEGKNQWVRRNCDTKESSHHMGKGQQNNMTGDKQAHVTSSNLKNITPLSATYRTKIVEEGLSNIVLGMEHVHMDYNSKEAPHGNTPSFGQNEQTAFSHKELHLDGPTQIIKDKCNQNSGKKSHAKGDHLKEPVLLHTKNDRGPCVPNSVSSNTQNVIADELLDVGPCNVHNMSTSSPNAKAETTPCWDDIVDVRQQGAEVMVPSTQNNSSNLRRNAKERDNVVVGVTQQTHECQENKTVYTVPSQSDKLELEAERSVNDQICSKQNDEHDPQNANSSVQVSPSHSSNALIPTQELEVIVKLERLMKLHGTKEITLDIAKKLTKQEHQIFLKVMRESGYLRTTDAKGTEVYRSPLRVEQLTANTDKTTHSSQSSFIGQQAPNYKTITLEQLELMSVHDIRRMQEQEQDTPPKDRPPQQPKRVQPARTSKSNSTRGK